MLANVALGAFAIQLAGGKVPIPEAWAWTIPILLAVVTTASTLLPRAGSEGLAAQVDALKSQGIEKRDMVVLPVDEAVRRQNGDLPPLSDEDIDRLARRGLELMRDQGAPHV